MTETDSGGRLGLQPQLSLGTGPLPHSPVTDPQPRDSLGDRQDGGSLWNSCQSMCSPEYGESSSTPNSAPSLNGWLSLLPLSVAPTELRIGPQKGKKRGCRTNRASQRRGAFESRSEELAKNSVLTWDPCVLFPVPARMPLSAVPTSSQLLGAPDFLGQL